LFDWKAVAFLSDTDSQQQKQRETDCEGLGPRLDVADDGNRSSIGAMGGPSVTKGEATGESESFLSAGGIESESFLSAGGIESDSSSSAGARAVGSEDVEGGSCTGVVAAGWAGIKSVGWAKARAGAGSIVTAGPEPEAGESWSDAVASVMICPMELLS